MILKFHSICFIHLEITKNITREAIKVEKSLFLFTLLSECGIYVGMLDVRADVQSYRKSTNNQNKDFKARRKSF